MKINLIPRLDNQLVVVERSGNVLTINGTAFDFTALPDGATLPARAIGSEWLVGSVSRVNGELELALILPHGNNPSQSVAFPEPITVTEDGPIALPFDPEPESAE